MYAEVAGSCQETCIRACFKFRTRVGKVSFVFVGAESTRHAFADCVADLDGCSLSEMDGLRDWEARFHSKYAVVGRVVS